MGNTKKNTGGTTGKGFDVSGQPDPKLKSLGWERRREAQAMMDAILEFQMMDINKLEDIATKIQNRNEKTGKAPNIKINGRKLTIRDIMAFQYVYRGITKDKFLLDYIDRVISKAPQNVELNNVGKPISEVKVTIVRNKEDAEQAEYPGDGSSGANS